MILDAEIKISDPKIIYLDASPNPKPTSINAMRRGGRDPKLSALTPPLDQCNQQWVGTCRRWFRWAAD
eukprot:9046349-Karenia_brevis.AAC.1